MPLVQPLAAARLYLCFVAVAGFVGALRAAEYQPLEVIGRRPVDAAFHSSDSNGAWKFSTKADRDGGPSPLQPVAATEVIAWGRFRDFKPGHRVVLVSGGEMIGYHIEIHRERLTLESDLIDAIELPLEAIAAIHFDAPSTSDSGWGPNLKGEALVPNQHALLLANGDKLNGRLVSINGTKVVFRMEDNLITLERTRVASAVIRPSFVEAPIATPFRTWVGLADGSRALATSIETDAKRVKLTLGPETMIAVPIEAVVALQPLGGRAVYLSDLKPAGFRHAPFLELPWDYQFDRNVLGGPLRANGRLYLKGIGMHSASRISYDLDSQYDLFAADLAIDDATRRRGSVACRVFLDDGSGDWQLKYESPVIRGGQQPVRVAIDVADAKRISLLVDFADRGDEQDHLNWLNARFVKKP